MEVIGHRRTYTEVLAVCHRGICTKPAVELISIPLDITYCLFFSLDSRF